MLPFYTDTGSGFRTTASGFGNTVWQQGVAVESAPNAWPPQQFIQQIAAPNQIEELRYHPQYSTTTAYHPQTGKSKKKFVLSLKTLLRLLLTPRCIFSNVSATGVYNDGSVSLSKSNSWCDTNSIRSCRESNFGTNCCQTY